MWLLILGLLVFLGIHCTRIFASDWREQRIAAMGDGAWKGLYSVVSLLGLVAMVYGYATAQPSAAQIYDVPIWATTYAYFAVPLGLILFVAANFPAGNIKRIFQHPMLWGTVLWSTAHLAANGDLASLLLFGGFLIWSVLNLVSCYSRGGIAVLRPAVWADVVSIILGIAVTFLFIVWAHEWLFGVRPV